MTTTATDDFQMLNVSQVQHHFADDPTMNIFLRIRPFLNSETLHGENQSSICVCEEDRKFLVVLPPKNSHAFKNYLHTAGQQQKSLYGFTHVFGPEADQEKFFEKTVVPSLHQFIAEGQNQLLFTYGVTGSGKTYTLLGTRPQLGILPRAVDVIFNIIGKNIIPQSDAVQNSNIYFVKPANFDQCHPIVELPLRRAEIQTRDVILASMKPTSTAGSGRSRAGAVSKATSTTSVASSACAASQAALGTASSESITDLFGYFENRERDKHVLPVMSAPSSSVAVSSSTSGASPTSSGYGGADSRPISGASIDNEGSNNAEGTATTNTISQYTKLQIWVSFVEIYNDSVYDLLVNSELRRKACALTIAQDHRATYLKGAIEVPVFSAHKAFTVFGYGQRNLRYAHTKLNRQSSRSHCIFTLKLVRTNHVKNSKSEDAEGRYATTVSVYSFCDLAGSERFKKTQTTGMRMKEGQSINCDLHFLHDVITILRNNQKLQALGRKRGVEVVPYRNCKLTHLFQNFFTGIGRATMVVNVSPCASVHDETLHALRFASIAKHVVTIEVKRASELLCSRDDDDDDEVDAEMQNNDHQFNDAMIAEIGGDAGDDAVAGEATTVQGDVSLFSWVHNEMLHALRFAPIAEQVVRSDVNDNRTSELLFGRDDDDDDDIGILDKAIIYYDVDDSMDSD